MSFGLMKVLLIPVLACVGSEFKSNHQPYIFYSRSVSEISVKEMKLL
jgi:hypothetical protein